jgi:DNA-binding XRE family transcriptional regulator
MITTETARAGADPHAAVTGNGPDKRPFMPVQTRARIGRPARPLTPEVSARHRFGAELRRWRTRRGLTHRRLAALVWHSTESVAKVEKGERWPSLDLTLRCERALGAGGALLALWPAVEQQRLESDGRRRPRRSVRSPGVGEPFVQ